MTPLDRAHPSPDCPRGMVKEWWVEGADQDSVPWTDVQMFRGWRCVRR
jgi:hypothetical protein